MFRSEILTRLAGKDMGKTKRGSKLRSWDVEEAKDKEAKFLRTCPCKVKIKYLHCLCSFKLWQVEKWQRRVVGDDGKVRWQKCDVELKIRRQKVTAFDIYYTIMQIYPIVIFSGVHSSDVNDNLFYLSKKLLKSFNDWFKDLS